MGKERPRLWEVDLLRAFFVFLMVFYHAVFDLIYFGDLDVSLNNPVLRAIRWSAPVGFLLIVGVSLSLSRHRARGAKGFLGYLVRGLLIFGLGLVITLVTLVAVPDAPIYFGVLHCIGACVILAFPFLKFKWLNLGLGSILTAVGCYLYLPRFEFSTLLWLGLKPRELTTLDYFPLLPWFGVVLLGIFAGNLIYNDYQRPYKMPDIGGRFPVRTISFLGRHTLMIYLVHQPVLIGFYLLLGLISL